MHAYNFDCPAEMLATIERAWDFDLRGLCKGSHKPFDHVQKQKMMSYIAPGLLNYLKAHGKH